MESSELDEDRLDDEEAMLEDITIHDGVCNVCLWYPRQRHIKTIEVGLVDVRASDGIRISYDFERDGWIIQQDSGTEDTDWQEVQFVRSWQRFPPKH